MFVFYARIVCLQEFVQKKEREKKHAKQVQEEHDKIAEKIEEFTSVLKEAES